MLKDFNNLLEEAKKLEPVIVSVAVAEDKEVLKAVKSATDLNIIKPILVGDKDKIESISREIGLKGHEIIGCQNPDESVKKAVEIVKNKEAKVLMKGLVNTSVYMRAILNKETGLRTGRLLSLLAVYELPQYHKLLYCTDSGINVSPNLNQKRYNDKCTSYYEKYRHGKS